MISCVQTFSEVLAEYAYWAGMSKKFLPNRSIIHLVQSSFLPEKQYVTGPVLPSICMLLVWYQMVVQCYASFDYSKTWILDGDRNAYLYLVGMYVYRALHNSLYSTCKGYS